MSQDWMCLTGNIVSYYHVMLSTLVPPFFFQFILPCSSILTREDWKNTERYYKFYLMEENLVAGNIAEGHSKPMFLPLFFFF